MRKRKSRAEYQRAWYAANKAKAAGHAKTYRENNSEQVAASKRKKAYGISQEQYEAFLTEQNGRCAICTSEEPGGRGSWHVDHCHVSSKVRGLLCHRCNVMLGFARDNVVTLTNAIAYLERQ